MHRGSLSIDRGINAIYRFIRFFLLYCNFLPTGSREEPKISAILSSSQNERLIDYGHLIYGIIHTRRGYAGRSDLHQIQRESRADHNRHIHFFK